MKIVSPQIPHKSGIGGIKLPLQGVQLQPMLSAGREVILGMVRDPTFGPMLMFGLGGIYVEILKDIQFAIAPVGEKEAKRMITGIKTYPLLAGVRGAKPSDIDALVDAILKFSRLVCDFPEIEEFEINPMMVFEDGKGALAVDVRLILKSDL